ncbi:hypothetical protein BC938DRAFT_479267 [Jimgerdemannia flammicorona]|uniref:Uncharacterized protein n=1 Tax=Jimgerdemannia flammicorona TaxID=994334 RepID=A0A433QL96_9FUNG|nr:hypothetical protein BC938DRAFT_479267 [Jimgerdemannia flammicorona]
MSSDTEPYIGCTAIVSYLKEKTKWPFTEFLDLQRGTILLSPPLSNKWNVLDLTWARRFMFKAKELDPNNSEALEKKVQVQRANQNLKAYWEGIIYERGKQSERTLLVALICSVKLRNGMLKNCPFVEQRPDGSYEKLDYVINRDEELSMHVGLVRSKKRRLLARDDQPGTKCTKPPQFDPVPSEDEGRSLQSNGDEEDLLELSGVEDQDETISNESKEEEEIDDINLGEFTIPNEPGFILKLRKVMDTFKKSTYPVDKTLAQLGILRLSSRQKIHEPSTMRAEAIRALSEQEKAELKTFTDVPAVMGVPFLRGTLKDHWQNLSSFTPSTTVERTTLRLHELFLTGCGIPQIKILGTSTDWTRLKEIFKNFTQDLQFDGVLLQSSLIFWTASY